MRVGSGIDRVHTVFCARHRVCEGRSAAPHRIVRVQKRDRRLEHCPDIILVLGHSAAHMRVRDFA